MKSQQATSQPVAVGGDLVEQFRIQCMKEAEQRFAAGLEQLVDAGKLASDSSFKSAVDGQPPGGTGQPTTSGMTSASMPTGRNL